jgi:hypothetical protein
MALDTLLWERKGVVLISKNCLCMFALNLYIPMRNFWFLFLGVVQCLNVLAQPGCPEVFAGNDTLVPCTNSCVDLIAKPFRVGETTSYTVESIPYNPPFPFTSGTPLFIGIDDIWSPVQPLPFPFCYYGGAYNQVVVGTNGVLTFDITQANNYCAWAFNASLPSNALFLNTIFGAYHDIDPSICGQIAVQVTGNAPCRTFVFNFSNVCHFNCNNLQTTQQIVLYETTNIIEVYIQNKPTCFNWNSGNALIGIQDASGTNAVVPPNRNTGPWVASNEAWRFVPDGAPTYQVSWFEGGNLIGLGDTVSVCPNTQTTYTAQVVYTRCDGSQITVSDDVVVDLVGSPAVPTANLPLCEGDTLRLQANSNGPNFVWIGPSNFNSLAANPMLEDVGQGNAGMYALTITDTAGCVSTGYVWVNVNPLPRPGFSFIQPICEGSPLAVTDTSSVPSPGLIANYAWTVTGPNSYSNNSNQQAPSFSDLPAGVFQIQLVLTTDSGCVDTLNRSGLISENPQAMFSYQALCFKENIYQDSSFGGTPPYSLAWDWNNDGNTDTVASSFSYVHPQSFGQQMGLAIIDSLGCRSDTLISVMVMEAVDEPTMPNVLLRNPSIPGNDCWNFESFAPGFNRCIDYDLWIYNRWGVLVFSTENAVSNPDLTCLRCFCGLNNNQVVLSTGTYFYLLKGKGEFGKGIEIQGQLMLME